MIYSPSTTAALGIVEDAQPEEPLTAQGERGFRLGILHGGKGGGGAPIENQYLTPQINKMLFYITKLSVIIIPTRACTVKVP